MTDNDIIKALECCMQPISNCDKCPLYKVSDECFDIAKNSAVDIINGKQAEIDRLEHLLDDKCDRCIAGERKKAVKEFADRLKATPLKYGIEHTEYYDKPPIYKLVPFIDEEDIDNLVKEMVGDVDEKERIGNS